MAQGGGDAVAAGQSPVQAGARAGTACVGGPVAQAAPLEHRQEAAVAAEVGWERLVGGRLVRRGRRGCTTRTAAPGCCSLRLRSAVVALALQRTADT